MTDGAARPTASDRLNADAAPTLMGLARAFRRAGRAPDPLMRVFGFAECGHCGGAIVGMGWKPVLRAIVGPTQPCPHMYLLAKDGRSVRRNTKCLFR